MSRLSRLYFLPEDFAAFACRLAESEDPRVIGARKRVVEERMKPLHIGTEKTPGLWKWAQDHGLDAHWLWDRGHLTNVYWPYPEANAGWVDYLRMGYGKPELLVRELGRRGGFGKIGTHGTADNLAFHQVTQIQVGLTEDAWWINWYQDRSAWFEQNNWLAKVRSDKRQRDQVIGILDDLKQAGYAFTVYLRKDVDSFVDYDDPEQFVVEAANFRAAGDYTAFSVELRRDPDDPDNNESTLPAFARAEFDRLLPLYRFTSWHPKTNNALGI